MPTDSHRSCQNCEETEDVLAAYSMYEATQKP
jgi:hypothetical protein